MSWTRADLKQRAKKSVNQNYWWFVLVCFILSVIGGTGSGGNFRIPSSISNHSNSSYNSSKNYDDDYYDDDYYDDDYYDDDYYDDDYYDDDLNDNLIDQIEHSSSNKILGMILGISVVIFMMIFIASIVLNIFVFAPLKVGINRFFMHAREGRRNINDIAYVFGCGHYLNVVKIMFLTGLKTFLWSLLFIIPGVVKSYEYRMIPYILSENPGVDSKRAFEMTRAMTNGEKANIWVLDLSFIGWEFLSTITLRILSLFWLNPYEQATYAELYASRRESVLQNGSVLGNELYEYYRDPDTGASTYGYDPNGYGQNNYNQSGYGENGYNQNGYNQNGYSQNDYGQDDYNQNGYNQNTYGQNDYNQSGYNLNGYEQNQDSSSGDSNNNLDL